MGGDGELFEKGCRNMMARFAEENPFWQWLGMAVDEAAMAEGVARVNLPLREELYQYQGLIHGGVLSALIDSAGAWAFALKYQEPLRTINLSVQYLEGVSRQMNDLGAEGAIVRVGGRIVIAEVVVHSGADREVARGQIIYSRAPRSKRVDE